MSVLCGFQRAQLFNYVSRHIRSKGQFFIILVQHFEKIISVIFLTLSYFQGKSTTKENLCKFWYN